MIFKRPTRLLGIYCVLQCWQRQIDGVEIRREDLLKVVGGERLTTQMVGEIAFEFRPWFKYHSQFAERDGSDWINNITFSRNPLDGANRINVKPLLVPPAGLSEQLLLSYMLSLVLGLCQTKSSMGLDDIKDEFPLSSFMAAFGIERELDLTLNR